MVPKTADRHREAVKAQVTHVTRLYYGFIFFVVYLLITIGAMDDSFLIRHEEGVRLPFFGVEVGARGFGFFAPILLLGFELYVIVEQWLLARNIARYLASDPKVRRAQLMIPWLLYPEPRRSWASWPKYADRLSRGTYWVAASMPTVVLIAIQWRYTAKHSWEITCFQAVVILLHLVIVGTFWRLTAAELRSSEWTVFRDDIPFARRHPGFAALIHLLVVVAAAVPIVLLSKVACGSVPKYKVLARIANVTLRSWEGDGKLDLHGSDLRFADLTGSDLRGADLRGADLRNAILEDVDLTGASLGPLRTAEGLTSTRLNDAVLVNARLVGANLLKADLGGAELTNADFSGALLERAILNRVSAQDALFVAANLKWAQLFGADLARADLSLASLGSADFFVARLSEAKLSFAEFPAELTGADLRNAVLRGVKPVILRNVDANGVYLDDDVTCLSLRTVDLGGARFIEEAVDQVLLSERLDELRRLEVKTSVMRHIGEAARRLPKVPLPSSSLGEGIISEDDDNHLFVGGQRATEASQPALYDAVVIDPGALSRCPDVFNVLLPDVPDVNILPLGTVQQLMASTVVKRACKQPIVVESFVDRLLAEEGPPGWTIREEIIEELQSAFDEEKCPALLNLERALREKLEGFVLRTAHTTSR